MHTTKAWIENRGDGMWEEMLKKTIVAFLASVFLY